MHFHHPDCDALRPKIASILGVDPKHTSVSYDGGVFFIVSPRGQTMHELRKKLLDFVSSLATVSVGSGGKILEMQAKQISGVPALMDHILSFSPEKSPHRE